MVVLDQFYTKEPVAEKYAKIVFEYIKENDIQIDIFMEPSAGTGSFFKLLPEDKRLGVDLEPKCEDVVRGDFFDYKWDQTKKIFNNRQSAIWKNLFNCY